MFLLNFWLNISIFKGLGQIRVIYNGFFLNNFSKILYIKLFASIDKYLKAEF